MAAIHYTLLLDRHERQRGRLGRHAGPDPGGVRRSGTGSGPTRRSRSTRFDGSPHLTPVVGFGGNVRAGVSALATPPAARSVDQPQRRRHRGRPGAGAADGARAGAAALRDAGGVHRRHRPRPPRQRGGRRPRARRRRLRDLRDRRRPGGRRKQLSRIGRSGTFASQNRADVQHGFDEISARIEAASKQFYLLSYCSPSRARASTRSRSRRTAPGPAAGSRYRFNANGFGPNCDPEHAPAVRHEAPAPAGAGGFGRAPAVWGPAAGQGRPDLEPEARSAGRPGSAGVRDLGAEPAIEDGQQKPVVAGRRAGGAVRGGATPPADARGRARGRGRSSCARGCSSPG